MKLQRVQCPFCLYALSNSIEDLRGPGWYLCLRCDRAFDSIYDGNSPARNKELAIKARAALNEMIALLEHTRDWLHEMIGKGNADDLAVPVEDLLRELFIYAAAARPHCVLISKQVDVLLTLILTEAPAIRMGDDWTVSNAPDEIIQE